MIIDWDNGEVPAKYIECCFENEAASLGDVIEGALDDCTCEAVISSG